MLGSADIRYKRRILRDVRKRKACFSQIAESGFSHSSRTRAPVPAKDDVSYSSLSVAFSVLCFPYTVESHRMTLHIAHYTSYALNPRAPESAAFRHMLPEHISSNFPQPDWHS